MTLEKIEGRLLQGLVLDDVYLTLCHLLDLVHLLDLRRRSNKRKCLTWRELWIREGLNAGFATVQTIT